MVKNASINNILQDVLWLFLQIVLLKDNAVIYMNSYIFDKRKSLSNNIFLVSPVIHSECMSLFQLHSTFILPFYFCYHPAHISLYVYPTPIIFLPLRPF